MNTNLVSFMFITSDGLSQLDASLVILTKRVLA